MLTTPFYYQMTGIDPVEGAERNLSTARGTMGSQVPLYLVRGFIVAIALTSIAPKWRSALASLGQMAPIGAFVAWAAASLIWTDSFGATLSSLVPLGALIIVGFCISVRLPPHHVARSVAVSSLIMAVCSVIWALFLPRYGVHQQADAAQSIHAGSWRGVYMHKNHLGQICAIYAVAIVAAGQSVIRSKTFKLAILLLLLGLIARSHSASAIVVLVVAPVMTWMLLKLRGARQAVILILAAALVIVASTCIAAVLAMLGRDATLTGRTEIWSLAFQSIVKRPILGFGFMSPTYGGLVQLFFFKAHVFDPHNGFIDLTLGLGLVGLALILLCFLAAARSAQRLRAIDSDAEDAALALFGALMAWVVAANSESDFRPLGSVPGLGYLCLTALIAARPKPRRPPQILSISSLFLPAKRPWGLEDSQAAESHPAEPVAADIPMPVGVRVEKTANT